MAENHLEYFVAIADELSVPIEFTYLDKDVYSRKDPFPLGARLVGHQEVDIPQDIMSVPDIVVNDKVAGAIIEHMREAIFNIGYNYLQFVPAEISPDLKYYFLHVMQYIPCLNHQQSSYSKQIDGISYVEKLVLDRSIIAETPFQERLLFRLEELPRIILFEEGLVDAISRVSPKGCYFIPVEEWRTDYRGIDPDDDDDYEFDGT